MRVTLKSAREYCPDLIQNFRQWRIIIWLLEKMENLHRLKKKYG